MALARKIRLSNREGIFNCIFLRRDGSFKWIPTDSASLRTKDMQSDVVGRKGERPPLRDKSGGGRMNCTRVYKTYFH